MLNRALELSLAVLPSRMRTSYQPSIRNFIERGVTESVCSKQQVSDERDGPHQNCVTVQRPEIGKCGKKPNQRSQSKD